MCEAAQTLLRWKSIAWMFIVREEQLSNVLNFNLNFFLIKEKQITPKVRHENEQYGQEQKSL